MFRSLAPSLSAALVAAGCLISSSASAIELCEPLLNSLCTSSTCYSYVGPVTDGTDECWGIGMVVTQDAFFAPPKDPVLDCKISNGRYLCEAWPQSEDISYAWSSAQTGSSVVDAINPFRHFSCQGGEVKVAVIGPGGGISIAAATLPACY